LAFLDRSNVGTTTASNRKSIWLAALETNVPPLEIPLAKGGDAFWLDSYTVGHVVPGEEGKGQDLYTISVKLEAQALTTPDPPTLASTFPAGTSVSNFRYSGDSRKLVFSAYVYSDGNLTTVQKQNEEYENRGNTAFVYDTTYERHWDTWTGPKHSSLFTVELTKNEEGKWGLGDNWVAPLKGTNHVRSTLFCPSHPNMDHANSSFRPFLSNLSVGWKTTTFLSTG